MSARQIILTGYAVIVTTGLIVGVLAHRSNRIATVGDVIDWILQTRSGRIALFAAWAWLGLHFLG